MISCVIFCHIYHLIPLPNTTLLSLVVVNRCCCKIACIAMIDCCVLALTCRTVNSSFLSPSTPPPQFITSTSQVNAVDCQPRPISSYAVAVVVQQHQIDCFLIPAAHHPMSCISHSSLSSSHSHTPPLLTPRRRLPHLHNVVVDHLCRRTLSSYAVLVCIVIAFNN